MATGLRRGLCLAPLLVAALTATAAAQTAAHPLLTATAATQTAATAATSITVTVERGSVDALLEELLSRQHLRGVIALTPVRGGLIAEGNVSNIVIQHATVGEATSITPDPKTGDILVNVADLVARVSARYDTVVDMGVTKMFEGGHINCTLGGGGIQIKLPTVGKGRAQCFYDPGLSIVLHESSSDNPAMSELVKIAVNNNLFLVHDEILAGVQHAVCRTLLMGLGHGAEDFEAAPSLWTVFVKSYLRLIILSIFFFGGGLYFGMARSAGKQEGSSTARSLVKTRQPAGDDSSDEAPSAWGKLFASATKLKRRLFG